MTKLNTAYVRKIVKDNGLDIQVKGRTNGLINIYPMNSNDLATFEELLKGMGYKTLLNSIDDRFGYGIYKR
jgi:ApbE superfamily uncharacterized protein (UPF0280 family)